MSLGVTDTKGGLVLRRGLSSIVLPGPGAVIDSGMLPVPGPPFWANWILDITYTGATAQQLAWAQEALNECTYPMEALGVKIDVVWGPLPPGADARHPYMITQFTAGDHATIYIPPWADDPSAPLLQGLPNAAANIKEFYKESFVHELGHVTVGATIDSPNRADRAEQIAKVAALFTRIDNGRRGTAADWDAPALSWADEIREAIAEAFKCSFYSERKHLIYRNRSNWTISRGDWVTLLLFWEPGVFDFLNVEGAGGPGQVSTQWFFGGTVFSLPSIPFVAGPEWMAGGIAKSRFASFDPGLPTPQLPPPGALNHGWGSNDRTQTWAFGGIGDFQAEVAQQNHAQSRKGKAELAVFAMSSPEQVGQCGAGLSLRNDLGVLVGAINYTWDTSFGFNLSTAYSITGSGISRGMPGGGVGVPLLPPALFVIKVDADINKITVGVTDGTIDPVTGEYIYADSISGPIRDDRPQGLYYPRADFGWIMLGDDPGFPGNTWDLSLQGPNTWLSALQAGPGKWTTYPTPVNGPYPYPDRSIVVGDHLSGLLRVD